MTPISLDFQHFRVSQNTQSPPWAEKVERWYQLDKAAYALADAFWRVREQWPKPDRLFLGSPGGSNSTDWEFANTGCVSAAKFVHTLPNVRGTSLYQALGWHGPVLCLQAGPKTLLAALGEALDEFRSHPGEIWVFSVVEDREVFAFRLTGVKGRLRATQRYESGTASRQFDSDLLNWLRLPTGSGFQWVEGKWRRELHAADF